MNDIWLSWMLAEKRTSSWMIILYVHRMSISAVSRNSELRSDATELISASSQNFRYTVRDGHSKMSDAHVCTPQTVLQLDRTGNDDSFIIYRIPDEDISFHIFGESSWLP